MTFTYICSAIYLSALFFIKPEPDSLNKPVVTYFENFKSVWATMLVGVIFIVVYDLTTEDASGTITNQAAYLFGLHNNLELTLDAPYQLVTHLFIHSNFLHLLTNIFFLGMLSNYERRKGAKRFFSVLLVAGLTSNLSALFYSEPIVFMGISGSLFGVAAAFFTDKKGISTKEWISLICFFVFITLILTLSSETEPVIAGEALVEDHLGHIFGAIGGILYCRYTCNPGKLETSKNEQPA